MEAIKVHEGQIVALMNDNIDTDQIIPKAFLKRIEKTGFGEFLFKKWTWSACAFSAFSCSSDCSRIGISVIISRIRLASSKPAEASSSPFLGNLTSEMTPSRL